MNWTAPLLLAALPLCAFGAFTRTPAPGSRPPQAPAPLFNRTCDQVLHALGPPDRVALGGGEFMRWIWLRDQVAHTTVTFFGQRAVHVRQRALDESVRMPTNPVPSDGAYLGQPLEQLLQRLGPPDAVRSADSSFHRSPTAIPARGNSILEYGDRWLYLAEDRVVRLGPRQVQEVHGPR